VSAALREHLADFVPNQVIVKLTPTAQTADALAIRARLNATVIRRFASIDAELWEIRGTTVADAVDRFTNDSRVAIIEPNFLVHTFDRAENGAGVDLRAPNAVTPALDVFPNDTLFDFLWGLHNTGQGGGTADADIDAPEAWSLVTGGSVVVAVIATGVDYTHEDLIDNIFSNPNETAGNGVDDDANGYIDDVRGWDFHDDDNDPFDDNGTGTICAGPIAAVGNNGAGVVGVSWSARILPLKFLDDTGSGSTADAIQALEYASLMGAKLCCNPWGSGTYSDILRLAIGEAGILFVAVAGNSGLDIDVTPIYPASYDLENIIAVAGTNRSDDMSPTSNYGLESVDMGAPGWEIASTYPPDSYSYFSSTSMAAAHVSGAACLLWSYAPGLTSAGVKNYILSSVDVIPSLQGRTVTGGRLNVANMLSLITDVDSDASPKQFALFANRPNPFNPATTIAYDLAEPVDVRLVLYDVRGRQVREMVRATQAAGRYAVSWDGRGDGGEYVASGVYFYRLAAGSFVQTRKMVLLK